MLILGDFAHHDWSSVPVTEHAGESGIAFQKVLIAGSYRIRKVRYSTDYRADHWCEHGHIVLVAEGRVKIEFRDNGAVPLSAGHVFWVSDGKDVHRMHAESGAELYIIDEH
jgi:AraC-like protein